MVTGEPDARKSGTSGSGRGPLEKDPMSGHLANGLPVLRHARVPGRQVETRFFRAGDGVRIEVHDAAEERPVPRGSLEDATDGRGLAVVSALADAWGVSGRNGVGKAVWAVLTVNGGDGGS
jgi:serine/threonine-protein kinase RsbW